MKSWTGRDPVPEPGRLPIMAIRGFLVRRHYLIRLCGGQTWTPMSKKLLKVSPVSEAVKKCHLCQSNRVSPPPAPLHPCQWPSQPWTQLHLDMDGPFLGQKFLVLIDAHSKWMEVELMTSTTSLVIISVLRKIFTHFGLPTSIVTDNGCNFVSSEFNDFLAHNGIKHWTSALYHPSSNGLAERAVQTFKSNISKLTSGSIFDKLSTFLFYNHVMPQSTT